MCPSQVATYETLTKSTGAKHVPLDDSAIFGPADSRFALKSTIDADITAIFG